MKFKEYKGLDLPGLAADVLKEWDAQDTFHKSISTREGHPTFVFYEGPPSANGTPGIHHVMARTIKDIFCRYKTQQGYLVHRKAGWDTHGLPVELGVEKKLGITKEDIGRTISIEEYNRACREAVMEYTGLWEELTRKMGYWVNMDDPYITYDNKYIETLWWLLKQLFDKGLLYKGYTIQPYSPAAGTGLSTHELNQPGCYRDVKDTTCTAQFKIIRDERSEKLFDGAEGDLYFLAWTTTPWTLPSNTALAVGPEIEYVRVKCRNPYTDAPQTVILAKELLGSYFTPKMEGKFEISPVTYKGPDFEGIRYEQLIPWVKPAGDAFRVILGDYVTTSDGTGIVHIAPTFGADDDRVARAAGIAPLFMVDKAGKNQPMVDRKGRFFLLEELDPTFIRDNVDTAAYSQWAGRYVKNAYDDSLAADAPTLDVDLSVMLKAENKVFKIEKHTHSYPHCWRTDKPVLYYPLDSWFIRTTALRDRMIELNKTIRWKPESTGTGRFGKWLEGLVDWNLSRSRFWGTPLPIWATEDYSEMKCIGSVEELVAEIEKSVAASLMKENPYKNFKPGDLSKENYSTDRIDLHRPYVDNIVLVSSKGEPMRREPDLIDVWFDSGATHYTVMRGSHENELGWPADLYLEGSDQHRGWFQSSLLTSVGANGHAPYKAVVSQGFTLDGQGRKMSKSLGNVIDPNKVCDEMGADIIRLWVASVDTSSDVSIDHEILARTSDAYRRFRNTLRFLLSELEGQFEPETDGVAFADLLPLDKLMVARLTQVQAEVDDAYSCYEFPRAYRALYDFVVTELSNVYLDALKDRLYCEKPGSLERRSAQTVLAELFSMLMRDLQPILSYTVDEAMAYAPAGCVDHQKYAALLDWYKSPITVDEANEFEGVLEASLELRSVVTKALEDARSAGTFTKSQQVRVKAVVPAEMYALLTGDKAVDLAEFYIVSDVELTQGEELSVAIDAAEGECCDRCWNYRTTVGEYNGHAHICKRCANAL